MRAFMRFLGMLLAAGAFVSFVVDGAKSIASEAIQTTPTGAIWAWISLSSLSNFQAAIERYVSPVLWDPIVLTILTAPFFIVLMVLSAVLMLAGRQRRSEIGFSSRG